MGVFSRGGNQKLQPDWISRKDGSYEIPSQTSEGSFIEMNFPLNTNSAVQSERYVL
jgi:hypothetical protein